MNAKKKLKYAVSLLFVIIVVLLFIPRYNHEYFYSKNKEVVVTKVIKKTILGYKLYFTVGEYSKNAIPEFYVSVTPGGRDWGYDLYFYKWADTIFIYRAGLAIPSVINLPVNIKYVDSLCYINYEELRNSPNLEKLGISGPR